MDYLWSVADSLHDRPRAILGFRKPSEVFTELMLQERDHRHELLRPLDCHPILIPAVLPSSLASLSVKSQAVSVSRPLDAMRVPGRISDPPGCAGAGAAN